MDNAYAQINVHWLDAGADDGQLRFHVEILSQYLLNDPDSLRAVRRAVKNILDYGAVERLPRLCKALDAYRQKVVVEREMAISESHCAPTVQVETQKKQPRQSTKTRSLSRRQEEESQLRRRELEDIAEE
ncbi:MAG: hypothetical protein M1837_000337 [Sclerophora amabilis]|nr:MAG: hypothetical protein M1837_000337 [Sclerophora amabilis]